MTQFTPSGQSERPETFRFDSVSGHGWRGIPNALAVPFSALEFTDVLLPIGKRVGALAVKFAILVFTYVFVPIGERLVCLSALGVGDSREILPFRWNYFLIPLLARHTYADHELQESYVRNSRLDWVIVRPGGFSDGPPTSSYRHGFTAADKSLKLKISQADVADFMLSQLADNTYLRQAPSLSY